MREARVLETSFAFILGLVPLVLAASLIRSFLITVLDIVFEWLREKTRGKPRPATDPA